VGAFNNSVGEASPELLNRKFSLTDGKDSAGSFGNLKAGFCPSALPPSIAQAMIKAQVAESCQNLST
jgi:hypothetical protein